MKDSKLFNLNNINELNDDLYLPISNINSPLQFTYLGKPYVKVFDESVKGVVIEDGFIYAKNESTFDKWYKNECIKVFSDRINFIVNYFDNIPKFSLRIRNMKTRWGVNNVTRRIITLNSELLKKDVSLIDYVIIHELCHFYEANHSSRFWKQVEKRYPKYKEARKRMKVE
jgi:predicted metal-dependent hydrolase